MPDTPLKPAAHGEHVEQAPAKLTLSLRMTGARSDGYHLIDAEMVSLDLADTLTFTDADIDADPADGLRSSAMTIEMGESASRGLPVEASADNLVLRALRLVGRNARVHVVKRIPAGGGLGGGSADAAAVFRWARRTDDADLVAASALGADISFCIRGGRARVTGIGEVVEPLPFAAATFTLCTPPFGVSTPAVYRAFDSLGAPRSAGPNDLEAAALAVEPRLAVWRDLLAEASGQTPVLAGSGSTWFVEGAHTGPNLLVARTIPAH